MPTQSDTLRESAVFNLSGAVVMVVDDSPFSLTLTTGVLSGFGVRPAYTVSSGVQAQSLLAEKPIDLLLIVGIQTLLRKSPMLLLAELRHTESKHRGGRLQPAPLACHDL